MKTKNNVQKTILRSGAVVISFVLISFTVSAQEFWKKLLTNSSFNEIAIAMVENSETTKKPVNSTTETDFYYTVEEEKETDLQLESWMLNDNLFSNNPKNEQALNLEGWMISEELWNS